MSEEPDEATIARLQELCERAQAEADRYGMGYDEALIIQIGRIAVTALPVLLEERERMAERLEITHQWIADPDSPERLKRVECKPWLDESCDGIACRDETIRLQDEELSRLRAELDAEKGADDE